ncbi:MAG: hypothetical protein KDM81_12165, partial [Verrucomicrobiae bacterium]|nr:hypothetical protein [Verrucomicrobiae bacterium]
ELRLEPVAESEWAIAVTGLAYTGQANALQAMNQFLVTPGSPAATHSPFNVDGQGNTGQWRATAADNWAIQYVLDFYFASSADGDPSPTDTDATFNDKLQSGFLIPVSQLTTVGLGAVGLDDPLDFHSGDFKQYLLEAIVPRLPPDATYLLVTQMAKIHPDYAEPGLPITINALVGNTTIAFTTHTLAAPPEFLSLRVADGRPVLRFTGGAAQAYEILRSADLRVWETLTQPTLTYPETGVVEWTDAGAHADHAFYRVRTITP